MFNINIFKEFVNKVVKFLLVFYNVFIEKDCLIVEINLLVIIVDGDVLVLDVKINFDDNVLFRYKDVVELCDLEEEDLKEIEVFKYDLLYIVLDGDIGCMVNGVGLVMVIMDMINYFGGNLVNFLDVGGSVIREKVIEVFKIILGDENVKGIFVNIFGGIMKCDVIVEGIVEVVKEVDLILLLVVCLEGINVELGKKILKDLGLVIELVVIMVEGV